MSKNTFKRPVGEISEQNLNLIIEEFNRVDQDDYNTIRNVLKLCPKRISVQFALDTCLSIKHLMKDKRSLAALDSVKLWLDDGTPIPQDIRAAAYAAAYAAIAAYAAAYAAADAAAAAEADAAADAAAYAAADAAYADNTPEWKQARAEKMREHLNRLKDLILQHVPMGYDNFLLQIAL